MGMATLPNIQAYPKTIMLNDGTSVVLRPLEPGDKVSLLQFFERVPEEERHYLKENVTAPEVVHGWTAKIDFDRVVPIVALAGDEIVADATLHRSRAVARRHVGELRLVVDPSHRGVGLGRRLLRELLDIAAELGLHNATFELVADREEMAIRAAISVGFQQVGVLKERIRDFWGNYQDLVQLELPLKDRELWWRF
jgi:L-amino acid N-acyltransferase YncA